MRRLFFRMSSTSVTEAKNRLKSVLTNDRINVTENKTLEKMKKEILTVINKYVPEGSQPPQITITRRQGIGCHLAAEFDTY